MAVSMTGRAPAWLRELADAKADYTELFGWPVSMRVGGRQLVIAIGTVLDAVSMPAALGARVRQELGIAMLSGPVFTDAVGQRWTFLTKLLTRIRPGVTDQLAELRVHLPPHGSLLPDPGRPHHRHRRRLALDRASGAHARAAARLRGDRDRPPDRRRWCGARTCRVNVMAE